MAEPVRVSPKSADPPSPSPESIERERLADAARWALAVVPGPIGTLICREIRSYLQVGFRFGGDSSLISELADQVLDIPLPDGSPSPVAGHPLSLANEV